MLATETSPFGLNVPYVSVTTFSFPPLIWVDISPLSREGLGVGKPISFVICWARRGGGSEEANIAWVFSDAEKL